MADENILRSYRSSDAARRASAAASAKDFGSNDPLAELARLIGQSDPFADLDRGSSHSSGGSPALSPDAPPADAGASDWRKTAAAMAREAFQETPAAEEHFAQVDTAVAAARSLRAAPQRRSAQSAYSSQADYPFEPASDRHATYAQAAEAQDTYADASYDDGPRIDSRFEDRFHDEYATAAEPNEQGAENYFFEGAEAPSEPGFYDDPPRARATNGLVTAVVLIGCGILGTAGAYGYRTYYSGPRPGDAPIIAAQKTPSKIVPAQAGGDSQSGKSSDRVGSANERVVARQEEPMTLPDPNSPRVVLPAPFTTSPGPGPSVDSGPAIPPPSPASAANQPTAATAATEPKKVRTVAIRPDGVDPMAPAGATSASVPTSGPSSSPSARPTQAAKPVARGGGPLSLEPQSGDAASAAQPTAHAPAAPAPATGGGPRLASASSSPAATGGGYLVQVSSQRSEADVQASFRNLQSKFPKELGEREAIVRRADLGPKGVYYRAMIGPFGSAGEADQFCGGLKAAGGQCIIQKN